MGLKNVVTGSRYCGKTMGSLYGGSLGVGFGVFGPDFADELEGKMLAVLMCWICFEKMEGRLGVLL